MESSRKKLGGGAETKGVSQAGGSVEDRDAISALRTPEWEDLCLCSAAPSTSVRAILDPTGSCRLDWSELTMAEKLGEG